MSHGNERLFKLETDVTEWDVHTQEAHRKHSE